MDHHAFYPFRLNLFDFWSFLPCSPVFGGFCVVVYLFFFVVLKIKICLQFINIFLAKLTILSLSQHDYRKADDKVAFFSDM